MRLTLRSVSLLVASSVAIAEAPKALGSGDDTCATATLVTPGVYTSLQTFGSWIFPATIVFDWDWFRFTAWPGQQVDVTASVTNVTGNHPSGFYTFLAVYEYSASTCTGTQIATSFADHVLVTNATSVPKDYVLHYYAGVNNSGESVGVTYDLTVDGHEIGLPFCPGDGTGTACPCSNSGAAGRGCANSTQGAGARLTAIGNPGASVGTDTLTLVATEVIGPGLFFQGDAQVASGGGSAFGDGLLCAGGAIVRIGVVFPTGEVATVPSGSAPTPVHVAGAVSPGDVRHYQCWYRDAANYCAPGTFNLTQGLTLTWGP